MGDPLAYPESHISNPCHQRIVRKRAPRDNIGKLAGMTQTVSVTLFKYGGTSGLKPRRSASSLAAR